MTEKQWWTDKINELIDEVGGTTIALNRENGGDYAIGYYYDKGTGKFNVYKNIDRGEQDIYKSTDNEVEALKEVYDMVWAIAESRRRDFRRRSNINVESEDLRSYFMQNISCEDKSLCHISQPVIRMQNGKYYIAAFLSTYSDEEKKSGFISRPSGWILADLATGNIVKQYQCKETDFSNADYDKKYDIGLKGEHDTSEEYYYKTDGLLDYVRAGILLQGKVQNDKYEQYMKRILANIPEDYQRFYWDLSIKTGGNDMNDDKKKQQNIVPEESMAAEKDITEESDAAETALNADEAQSEETPEVTMEEQPPQDVPSETDTDENAPADSKPAPDTEPAPDQEQVDESSENEKLSEILDAVNTLQECFNEKIENDEHKDQLFDNMHKELVSYQNGALEKISDSMALDIIQLADSTKKNVAIYEKREPTEENYKKLLRVLKGNYEDLQDVLYRQNIEPYNVPGHDVDAKKQKIIATVDTDKPNYENKVAVRVKEGYEKDGSVFRPEWIKIYKYKTADQEEPEETTEE